MSRNSRKSGQKLLGLVGSLMLLLPACDPCQSLAEKMCDCKYGEGEEGRRCRSDLNLAKSLIYFEVAKDPKVCLKALKECPCDKLYDGDDRKCGMYRDLMPD